MQAKAVRYELCLPADVAFETYTVPFTGPEAIERFMIEKLGWKLSSYRCPCCGVRLAYLVQFAAVLPEHRTLMFTCRNSKCKGKLYLAENGKLRPVPLEEYYQMIGERHRQNMQLLKEGKLEWKPMSEEEWNRYKHDLP